MARAKHHKCECRCGQSPAEVTRSRKACCPCGASIIYLSRTALATVNASCIACGGPIEAVCLFDRAAQGDADAVATLESRHDAALQRAAPKMYGAGPTKLRCGCGATRKPHGACKKCGSTHPPTTSFMHPRAARVIGGDMPF